ncbi:MAG: response regulator [Desulfobulbaceae bacterium]|nr:response regulator [Desulfobulbaceae bacterium]
MSEHVKILCVDDEPNVLRALKRLFIDEDYEIITAESGEDGLAILEKEYPVQLIISDYRMPVMDGVDFFKMVCEKWPKTIRIVLSGYAYTAAIVAAINEGQIYKFIAKPWDDIEIKVTIAKALEVYFLNRQNERLTSELRQANEELGIINLNLEEIVRERTNDILFQNKVLQFSQNVLHCLPWCWALTLKASSCRATGCQIIFLRQMGLLRQDSR